MPDSAFSFSQTNSQTPICTISNIDAKAVANTLGYTNNTSQTLVVTGVVVRCISAVSITNGPTLGVGTLSGTSNIVASVSINALTTTSNVFGESVVGMNFSVPAGGTVYVNLTGASTGTSQTIAVDINGYFTN